MKQRNQHKKHFTQNYYIQARKRNIADINLIPAALHHMFHGYYLYLDVGKIFFTLPSTNFKK